MKIIVRPALAGAPPTQLARRRGAVLSRTALLL